MERATVKFVEIDGERNAVVTGEDGKQFVARYVSPDESTLAESYTLEDEERQKARYADFVERVGAPENKREERMHELVKAFI